MIFGLYVVVSNFSVNSAHNLIGSFYGGSSYYCVSCFYIELRWTNQSHLTMSLTSPVLCISNTFYFLSRLLLLYLMFLLSSDRSNSLDDESDNDWSESRSSGTCSVPLRSTIPLVVLVAWGMEYMHLMKLFIITSSQIRLFFQI